MRQFSRQFSEGSLGRLRTGVFLLCLLPALRLAAAAALGRLGVDPVETLTRSTGIWTLNFLFITLAVTPVRKLSGWQWLGQLRRMLGLYCFFYACLHFLTYLVFDQFFDWAGMVRDIAKRPYITVGFTAFLLLFPLALTSTDAMIRRLGGRNWRRLHRLVYAIAMLGVLHYLWLVKRDITDPAWYVLVLGVLLSMRLLRRGPSARMAPAARGVRS